MSTCTSECSGGDDAQCTACLVDACQQMCTDQSCRQQCEQVDISRDEGQVGLACMDECVGADDAACQACLIAACKQMCGSDDACQQQCDHIQVDGTPGDGCGQIAIVCLDECASLTDAQCKTCLIAACKQMCPDDACKQQCDNINPTAPGDGGGITFVCVDECRDPQSGQCQDCLIAACKQACPDDGCKQQCDGIDISGGGGNQNGGLVCMDECNSGDVAKCEQCVIAACKNMCPDDACKQQCDNISL